MADRAQRVAEAVAELPEPQLEVLRLSFFDGLSHSPASWPRSPAGRAWGGYPAAAAAAGLAVLLADGGGPVGPVARAAISGENTPALHGEALLYASGTGGTVRLTLRDVPSPPPGHHYEVWVLPRGTTAMVAVGTFRAGGETVELSLALPGRADLAAVDVSVEEDGGPAAHSDTSLAGGAFE